MDEHFEKRGRLVPWVKRRPSEYIERDQIFVSCEPGEKSLPFAIECLGAKHIMYASDYPHWDGEFPESTRPLRTRTDITEEARSAVLEGAARKFYGI